MKNNRKIALLDALQRIGSYSDLSVMLECSESVLRSKISGKSEWTATDLSIILKNSGLTFDQIAF